MSHTDNFNFFFAKIEIISILIKQLFLFFMQLGIKILF